MASTFAPGLDSMKQAGIPVKVTPYNGSNQAQIKMSLETMAQKMRDGSIDASVRGWAMDCFKRHGLDGRGLDTTPAKQASALLDDFRAATTYASDPYAAESIQSAAATLCLRPNLCVRGGDCIPAGTLLLRDDYQFVPIEKIRPGDRIWGLDRWTEVKATAIKGSLWVDAIEMNNGSTMHLTGDHKVYAGRCKHGRAICPTCNPAKRQETFQRVMVSDLQEGEVLLQPDRIAFGSQSPEPARMYVEGLALADGWVDKEKSISRFCIAGRDGKRKEAQKREVVAICERLGIQTHWHKRYVRVSDPEWAKRLLALGDRARFKHLETIDLTEASAKEALRGLMADSTQNSRSDGRTYSTTSRMLMLQVRVLSRMFGISMGYSFLSPEKHGGAGRFPMWRLCQRAPGAHRNGKTLAVRSIHRRARKTICWDIQTEDHYVYLPEHDVTVSNCDDLVVGYGSLCLSVGIPVQIVKQSFGGDAQDHVLAAVFDGTDWRYADPSTNLPFGSAVPAKDEQWVDPFAPVGTLPEEGPRLITLGRPQMSQMLEPYRGLGQLDQWGLGQAAGQSVSAGTRYQLDVILNYPADQMTPDGVAAIFSQSWDSPSAVAMGPLNSDGTQSWRVVGTSKQDGTLIDTNQIKNVALSVVDSTQQCGPGEFYDTSVDACMPTRAPWMSIGTIALIAAGVVVVGGVVWVIARRA